MHTDSLPRYGKGTEVLFLCPRDSGLERGMQMWEPFLKGKTKIRFLKGTWASPGSRKEAYATLRFTQGFLEVCYGAE